jgi:hypothetical protein
MALTDGSSAWSRAISQSIYAFIGLANRRCSGSMPSCAVGVSGRRASHAR